MPTDPEKFAEAIKEGNTLKDSLIRAGVSPSVARKGRAAITKPMLDTLAEHHIKLAKRFGPEERGQIARGALLDNVLTGQDKAVRSIELMGKDKEVAIFQADTQVGIVLAMPKAPLPKIEAHVLPELDE